VLYLQRTVIVRATHVEHLLTFLLFGLIVAVLLFVPEC